jgi:5-methylcytosine-specific restriction endonuclease McrBC GTP-binding regulatory subunit McrB
LKDYSVLINERTFLEDPLAAILGIDEMSLSDIQGKIRGLAFAQRVLLPDSDESLFVPAVLYEAHRAWKRGLSLTSYPW